MPIPLSKLKDTIKSAALAVTNAAEELFQEGLLIQGMDDGISFQIQVFDDSVDPLVMQVSETTSAPVVTQRSETQTPADTKQTQQYGRETTTEVTYEG